MTDGPSPTARVHKLKTVNPFWSDVAAGNKTFDVRVNDRNFAVGDILWLDEYDAEAQVFSGRTLLRQVTYIYALDERKVVMGIKPVFEEPDTRELELARLRLALRAAQTKLSEILNVTLPCNHTARILQAGGRWCTDCGAFQTDNEGPWEKPRK